MQENILTKSNHILQCLTGGSKIILPNLAIILFFIASTTIVNIAINSTNSAFALSYQSTTTLDFTINPTISLTVSGDLTIDSLMPGDYNDSNIITVTAESNSISGYNLSATASSNNLVNTANSNYVFNNLSTAAGTASTLSSITPGYWGYSYSVDNGTNWISGSSGNTATGYAGLPVDNDDNGATGVRLLSTNTHTGSSSIQFKIGASATTTQVSGNYTGTVNFYAVANPSPVTFSDAFAAAGKTKLLGYYKMQDMTSNICQLVEQGSNTTLIDTRDNEVYTIAKLKDDNCWMTKNLNLSGNMPLYSTTSNVPSGYESSPYYTLPASDVDGFIDSGTEASAYVYNSNSVICNAVSPCFSYYSSMVAFAGANPVGEVGANYEGYDICPKSWRMPGIWELWSITYSYSSISNIDFTAKPFYAELSGTMSANLLWGGSAGVYLSRDGDWLESDDFRMHILWMEKSSASRRMSRINVGTSIRCIAK